MPPPRTSYGVSQLISDVNERNRISHPFAVWLVAILSAVLWSALAAVCWRRLGLEQPSAKRSAEVYGEEGEQDAAENRCTAAPAWSYVACDTHVRFRDC